MLLAAAAVAIAGVEKELAVVEDATVCGAASTVFTGVLKFFIGVNSAVNAISLLASGITGGAGTGNCGALITVELGAPAAGEDCGAADVVDITGVGGSATIAVNAGKSATVRGCFRESATA